MGLPGDALAAALVGLVSIGTTAVLVVFLLAHSTARIAFGRPGRRIGAAVGAVGLLGSGVIGATAIGMGFLSYVDPVLYPVGWIVALLVVIGPVIPSGLLLLSAATGEHQGS